MSEIDMNVLLRRAAGREPAQPARDEHGRFVHDRGLDGGARAPRPERQPSMNDFLRQLAGLEHPCPPRGRNGLPLDR